VQLYSPPDGNIRAQLSGEDGHVTLTITSKTEDERAFLRKIKLHVIHKPNASEAGEKIVAGSLDHWIFCQTEE